MLNDKEFKMHGLIWRNDEAPKDKTLTVLMNDYEILNDVYWGTDSKKWCVKIKGKLNHYYYTGYLNEKFLGWIEAE